MASWQKEQLLLGIKNSDALLRRILDKEDKQDKEDEVQMHVQGRVLITVICMHETADYLTLLQAKKAQTWQIVCLSNLLPFSSPIAFPR